jgi:ERCC4-type nuclease
MSPIYVDQRIGSNHLAKLIPGSQLELLDYGDVCFESADGRIVGVELKTISDAISSMTSGRLADHQVPGLIQMYDVIYLIVEGYYRCDPDSGMIQWRRGKDWTDIYSGRSRVLWSSFDGWLTSMETLGGIHLRRTTSAKETAATIISLYQWWQKSDHKSLHVFNTAMDIAAIERPGFERRVAKEFPMIGWERSKDVAAKFKTVFNMVTAPVSDWLEIKGIGQGIATKVQNAIHGRK